ncbi:DUF2809 domain-containing protein [Actinotalea sp. BY-33]|uniref:DUF2809 domain-containing protein n=1 Tax=Actinotalea soli TaxID=2819234 RepID=A0A939LNY2_9CELL|nr:DUF2809 domain-containing protein [Actinotalea soli]MBO1751471.1 DUF2809 domain-containing protein [Actinotalea soli]
MPSQTSADHVLAPPEPLPRVAVGGAAVAVVGAGLVVSRGDGLAADLGGGVLYAVLVTLLVALVSPRRRPVVIGAVALAVCVLVELAQLTPVPAALVEVWEPVRYVLGTTFHAPDLAAYAVGAALTTAALALARRDRARRAGLTRPSG